MNNRLGINEEAQGWSRAVANPGSVAVRLDITDEADISRFDEMKLLNGDA